MKRTGIIIINESLHLLFRFSRQFLVICVCLWQDLLGNHGRRSLCCCSFTWFGIIFLSFFFSHLSRFGLCPVFFLTTTFFWRHLTDVFSLQEQVKGKRDLDQDQQERHLEGEEESMEAVSRQDHSCLELWTKEREREREKDQMMRNKRHGDVSRLESYTIQVSFFSPVESNEVEGKERQERIEGGIRQTIEMEKYPEAKKKWAEGWRRRSLRRKGERNLWGENLTSASIFTHFPASTFEAFHSISIVVVSFFFSLTLLTMIPSGFRFIFQEYPLPRSMTIVLLLRLLVLSLSLTSLKDRRGTRRGRWNRDREGEGEYFIKGEATWIQRREREKWSSKKTWQQEAEDRGQKRRPRER